MTGSLLRGGAAGAVLAATIGLASALTACASGTGNAPVGAAGAGSGTSIPSAVPSASPSPSASASVSPSAIAPSSVNPGGPMSTAPATTPPPVAATPPAKSKYVPIEKETRSSDGRTLYLQIEAHGGACGQYVVVLQETTANVHVGMAQLEPKVGVMCPMYIGPRTFTIKLSSPVGTRTVIDLATNKPLGF